MPAPITLLMPRGMWGEPYRMGVNGAHNTIGENVGAYNNVVPGRLQSTISVGVQGMVPSIVV